jgi:hypothetical protein
MNLFNFINKSTLMRQIKNYEIIKKTAEIIYLIGKKDSQ